MEQTYEKLAKEDKNNVEEILKALKEAKLVGGDSKVTEEEARNLLKTTDDNKVTLEHFKEVLSQLSSRSGRPLAEVHHSLAHQIGAAAATVEKAAQALKNVFHTD